MERQFENWIETGRQFVDGVAGNRPGKRRAFSTKALSSASVEKVGRWVGDKLDWFLEDEDAWTEPWQSPSSMELEPLKTKKPLQAISRRNALQKHGRIKVSQEPLNENEWPLDSSFRVEKWQRPRSQSQESSINQIKNRPQSIGSPNRPLPKSSRRRS